MLGLGEVFWDGIAVGMGVGGIYGTPVDSTDGEKLGSHVGVTVGWIDGVAVGYIGSVDG